MSDRAVLFTTGVGTAVDSTSATSPHDSAPYARMKKDETVYLIREGLGNIPTGATASGWTQTFRAVGNFGGGSVTFKLYKLAASWQSSVLWADRPAFTADTPVSLTGTVTAGGLLSFDTTTLDALAIANPAADFGFGLVLDTAGVEGYIYTLSATDGVLGEDVTVRPTHGGEYRQKPVILSLSPSGGRTIGTRWPVVRGDVGDAQIAYVKVQQKVTNTGFVPATGFSSPAFDSGWVPSTDGTATLDLLATAFGGFSALGVTSYWTMAVEDTDGNVSDFEAPVANKYAARATVTTDVARFVGSTQPTLAWSHSLVQTASQVIQTDAISGAVVTDSGVRQGSTAAYTPTLTPAGKSWMLPDSRDFNYEIRVWDNVTDREATPGCPIYGSTTGTYAFSDDVTVRAPSGLLVTHVGSSPWNLARVSFDSPVDATDHIVLVRDDLHLGRYKPSELAPPEIGEGSVTYSIPDWTSRGYTQHIYGARIDTGQQTSHATEYLQLAADVTGVSVVNPATGVYAQHSGTRMNITSTDQVGVNIGLGQVFPTITSIANGGKAGSMGGKTQDEDGLTAVEWEKAWRNLGDHPAPVQIAYGNTSFEGFIWNVNSSVNPDDPDPFRKEIDFEFAQTGAEHLTDEPPAGTGYTITTADFESGTNNTNITTAGPDDLFAVTGPPKFMTSAAFHGSMGLRLLPNQVATWLVPNVSAFAVSIYVRIRANTEGGVGSHTFFDIEDVNGTKTAEWKVKPSGTMILENGSTTLAKSHGNVTFGTTTACWFRVDIAAAYDEVTGITHVQSGLALQPESNVYTDTLNYDIEGEDRPYKVSFVTGAELTLDADTVRRANNASSLLGAFDPDSALPSPELVFAGGSTSSGMLVRSLYNQVDEGISVGLALSTSSSMTSPIAVTAQTINTDRVATHTVTGLSANTRYYGYRVQPSTGNYFGDQFSFKTGPSSSGAWSRKIALVSCQDNGADAPQAWQDIIDQASDAIFHVGDYGYVGQDIDTFDPYSKDIIKRVNAHRGNPIMRAAIQSASLDVITISDHEIHINGDHWQGDSGLDSLGCLHSIRERDAFYAIQPVRTYLNPGVDRSYTFDYGSTVRVIVTDFRTPLRSISTDPDDSTKQLWGAAQEAAIFGALSTTKANIIVNETAWWLDSSGDGATDKPNRYPDAQQRFYDKLHGTGAYAGGHNFSTHSLWMGGDRHYLGYYDIADSDLGIPQIISSGMSKNSLGLQNGESPTWSFNSGLNTLQSIQLRGTTSFTITYSGQTTSSITAGDSAASVKTKLEALSNIAPGDVVVLANGTDEDKNVYDYQVRFGGTLNQNQTALTTTGTGGTPLVIKVQAPVVGWIPATISDNGSGVITVSCVARAVLDTSGPFSSWVIGNAPGGTKTYTISP